MERAIEFILNRQANIQNQQATNQQEIAQLTANVNKISEEMREGFNLLIASMTKTDRLVEQIAMLNINTSKRVTALEKKVKNGKKSK